MGQLTSSFSKKPLVYSQTWTLRWSWFIIKLAVVIKPTVSILFISHRLRRHFNLHRILFPNAFRNLDGYRPMRWSLKIMKCSARFKWVPDYLSLLRLFPKTIFITSAMTILQRGCGPCFCSKTATLLYAEVLILKLIFHHLHGAVLGKHFYETCI